MESRIVDPSPHQARRPQRAALSDQVRDLIAEEFIASGVIAPGGLLPSEKDLSERYAVSRPTIRFSLHSLQDAGLVIIRNGVGAVVTPSARPASYRFDRLGSLETFGREAGKPVSSRDVEWLEGPASEIAAERLGLAPGHRVLAVHRLKVVEETPVGWFIDTIPEGVISFDVIKDEFTGSTLDVLLDHQQLDVAYEDADLEPVNLPADIAGRLGVEQGTAALFVDAVTWSVRGQPLQWSQFWLLRKTLRFSARRRTQIGRAIR
jgi:GntR family transcriptional regulator